MCWKELKVCVQTMSILHFIVNIIGMDLYDSWTQIQRFLFDNEA